MATPTWLRAATRRPLLMTAITLPAAIFAAAASFDYVTERDRVRDQVASTAAALAEHAQKVVETTDLVLARVTDAVRGMGWDAIQGSGDVHQLLLQFRNELPQLESVFIVSPAGVNVATTRAFPLAPAPDVSDRDYFLRLRAGFPGTFISDPFRSRLDNGYAFTATRAIWRGGAFDGLVGATVSPRYFSAFYAAAVDYPGHSTATLVRDDGTVLFRYPGEGPPVSRLPPDSAFMRATAARPEQGSYSGWSAIDGRQRFGVYRRLSSQPLYIAYSIEDSVYLARWSLNLLFLALFSGLLATALLLLERTMARRAESELRASRELVAETERRQKAELALQQSQKMEALGRLTGGVAHDFNNLLTAILGPLELAARRVTDPRVLRLIEAASDAAQRGASLTRHMLAVTRTNDAAAALLDPNKVIEAMRDIVRHSVGPLVQVRYDLDPAATPVLASKVGLDTTLLNLCVNARDAIGDARGDGGGEVVVRTRRIRLGEGAVHGLAPGEYVRIDVADNGSGMSEEVRTRALEPFFTTKEPGKGTGLGLSGAHGFAQSCGGALTIESAVGAGSTVSLVLPLAPGVAADDDAAAAVPATGRPLRILLVDDDGAVRSATRAMLEEAGHQVSDVASGADAVAMVGRQPPFDLMVTDYAMPGMSGDGLAAEVRGRLPDLPILFVTGYAKDDALAAWTGRNATVLAKPFVSAELAAAVARAVAPGRPPA